MTQEGHKIWNHIDVFCMSPYHDKLNQSYNRLQSLLAELGLTISTKKLVPPSTQVVCLGIYALPLPRDLTKLATSRLSNAFAYSTKRAYATLFSTFLAFAVFMSWELSQVTVLNLLCFLECLHYNGVKHSQMANYLSAIKSKFLIFGLDY